MLPDHQESTHWLDDSNPVQAADFALISQWMPTLLTRVVKEQIQIIPVALTSDTLTLFERLENRSIQKLAPTNVALGQGLQYTFADREWQDGMSLNTSAVAAWHRWCTVPQQERLAYHGRSTSKQKGQPVPGQHKIQRTSTFYYSLATTLLSCASNKDSRYGGASSLPIKTSTI